MHKIYDESGRKIEYLLNKSKSYRISGAKKNIGNGLMITSEIRNLDKGMLVTIEQLNVNEFHPKMMKVYILEMDLYIDAIDEDDITIFNDKNVSDYLNYIRKSIDSTRNKLAKLNL